MYENLVQVGLLGHHRDSLCVFQQLFNGECFLSIFFLRTLRCRNMFHLYHLDDYQSMTTGRYAFACALATTLRKHCLELFKGQINLRSRQCVSISSVTIFVFEVKIRSCYKHKCFVVCFPVCFYFSKSSGSVIVINSVIKIPVHQM